jgi:hypothetical protein
MRDEDPNTFSLYSGWDGMSVSVMDGSVMDGWYLPTIEDGWMTLTSSYGGSG